jgi:thiamine-monophosphate kinase
VINEAIELAKRFGGTDGHKYVNGVLDRLAPELRPGESRGNDTSAGQPAGDSGKSRREKEGTTMSTTPASPEFDVIARHFARPARNAVLGVGDDCALVRVSNGMDLAVSTDTMVSGTHFFPDVDPETLGHKALAVNLSDMAAMGAMPYWATLALTVPEIDHEWLEAFAKGFYDLADEFEVSLIGGDTTRGPLTLTVTIFGEVPAGAALKRSGARDGHDIWVSGLLGDAALAVAHRNGRLALDDDDYRNAVMRLYEPTPRVKLGQALRGVATAAIDISDGLVGDLGHICALSGLGATVEVPLIPLSAIGARHIASVEGLRAVLAGGDDYELCFTAPTNARESMEDLSEMLDIPLTRIGRMHKGRGVSLQGADGKPLEIELQGFDHFSAPA